MNKNSAMLQIRVVTYAVSIFASLVATTVMAQQPSPNLTLGYLTLPPLSLTQLPLTNSESRATQSSSSVGQSRPSNGFNLLEQLPLTTLTLPNLEVTPLRLNALGYTPNPVIQSQFLQSSAAIPTAPSPIAQYVNPGPNPNGSALNLGLGLEAIGLIRNLGGGGNLGNLSGISSLINGSSHSGSIPGLPALPSGR